MSGREFFWRSSAARSEGRPARRNRRLLAETLESRAMLTVPAAVSDYFETAQNTPLAISVAALLSNDSDADGDSLQVALALGNGPWGGKLTLGAAGELFYTPAPNFYGDDGFKYFLGDGQSYSQSAASVTIRVKQAAPPFSGGGTIIHNPGFNVPGIAVGYSDPSAPIANPDKYTTAEDTRLTIDWVEGLLSNDTSGDGSPLSAKLETPPAHGEVTVNADGSFSYLSSQDYFGSDQFVYRLTNGTDFFALGTVSLDITPVNDPPVIKDDPFTTEVGLTRAIWVSDLLANDRDVENDRLTLIMPLPSAPQEATLALYGPLIYFTPKLGLNGTDGFDYLATDGQDFSAASAHVSVTTTAPVRHNARLAVDVDSDARVTANDVLLIINCINSIGSGHVVRLASYSRDLLDVDGDQEITANDVLAVINAINSRRFDAEGEAENVAEGITNFASDQAVPNLAFDSAELFELIAYDTVERTGRPKSIG